MSRKVYKVEISRTYRIESSIELLEKTILKKKLELLKDLIERKSVTCIKRK